MVNLKDLLGLFTGETLYLLLGLKSPSDKVPHLKEVISLGLNTAPWIYEDLTFWSTDVIKRDWPGICGLKRTATRYFIPTEHRLGKEDWPMVDSVIPFTPHPLNVLPPEEMNRFLLGQDRGDKIATSWGPIALAVGIAFALDFPEVRLVSHWSLAETYITPDGKEVPLSNREKEEWEGFWESGAKLASDLKINLHKEDPS